MVTITPIHDRFDAERPVVGMVHLPALPGAPDFDGDRDTVRTRTLDDARRLVDGGVDAVLVENFGDAPFYPDSVPTHVVAELTAVAAAIRDAVDVPLGINVLRNDAEAALSIAAAADADFIRVNVHVGTAATDQGIVEGRAHETSRLREQLDADVCVLADVHVKHATPVGNADIAQMAIETVERGRADGLIVSGSGTGAETSFDDIERVADVLGDHHGDEDAKASVPAPVFVGSGVTSETIGDCFAAGADGVIVGTALKEGGKTTNPVSKARVEDVVSAARESR